MDLKLLWSFLEAVALGLVGNQIGLTIGKMLKYTKLGGMLLGSIIAIILCIILECIRN